MVSRRIFGREGLRGWQWGAGLGLSLALALTSALTSHSAALLEDTVQALLVDMAHTVAAAIWVGGLLYLALALTLARGLEAELRSWLNLSLILDFSALAAISVGILLASGVYLAWQHVGSWTSLVGTAYGIVLLIKLGLALPVFVIAGINLLFIKPRLNAAYENPEAPAATRTMRRFGRLVRLEALLAFLILAAAGALTDFQRGKEAPLLADAPGETVVRQTADDLIVTMTITPALVGQNQFDIYLEDESGEPVTNVEEVSVRFTFLEQSLWAAEDVAVSQGNGHYSLEGSYISLIGAWQLEVAIRRPDTFDTFAPYRLEAGLGGEIRPFAANPPNY